VTFRACELVVTWVFCRRQVQCKAASLAAHEAGLVGSPAGVAAGGVANCSSRRSAGCAPRDGEGGAGVNMCLRQGAKL